MDKVIDILLRLRDGELSVKETASQIDALYPQGDEKGLLSPESIEDICSHPENYMGERQEVIREGLIAEAQQSLDKRKEQEGVEELIDTCQRAWAWLSLDEHVTARQLADKIDQVLKKQEGL